ncbi:MAG: hypothetical protein QF638_06280 [Acidimicrobiales bacterium]|nr:hypothetical protein [Acidimicrobiales bacterium]
MNGPTTTLTTDQQDYFFDQACSGLVIDLRFCCSEHSNSPLTPYQRGIAHGHDESDIARYYYDRAAGYTIGDVDAFIEGLGQGDGGHHGADPFFADQAAAEAK